MAASSPSNRKHQKGGQRNGERRGGKRSGNEGRKLTRSCALASSGSTAARPGTPPRWPHHTPAPAGTAGCCRRNPSCLRVRWGWGGVRGHCSRAEHRCARCVTRSVTGGVGRGRGSGRLRECVCVSGSACCDGDGQSAACLPGYPPSPQPTSRPRSCHTHNSLPTAPSLAAAPRPLTCILPTHVGARLVHSFLAGGRQPGIQAVVAGRLGLVGGHLQEGVGGWCVWCVVWWVGGGEGRDWRGVVGSRAHAGLLPAGCELRLGVRENEKK